MKLYYFPEGIKFRTKGVCGGQILVNYRNKWENVCFRDFPLLFYYQLCYELGCGDYNPIIKTSKTDEVIILLLPLCLLPESRSLLFV